jgi:methyl-accepting chemotaxis protein
VSRIFDNLRLGTKLNLFVLLIIVCVAAGGVGIAAAVQHELLASRIEQLRAVTQSAKNVASGLEKQVAAGELTHQQAIQTFTRLLATMTYDGGQGYIFAYQMDGTVVSLPDPKLIGTNRLDTLVGGRPVAREIRDSAARTGEGVVYYDFPRVGETIAIPKVSYATTFPAWDMFLGSGAYIDDLTAKFRSAALAIGLGVGFMALLIGGAAWFVSRRITRPLDRLQGCMRRLAEGEIELEIPDTARRDEVGTMAQAVEIFKRNAVEHRRLEAEAAASRAQSETERERAAMERAKAAEEQAEVVRQLGDGLKTLAAGDLTIRLGDSFAAAYAQIRQDFNEAVDRLKETLVAVVSSAGTIKTGSNEISSAADDLSRRTEQQAASLEETAAALTEITATVKKSSEGANHARKVVATADEDAKKSAVVVRQAVEAMDAIAKSSEQIGQIIGVIDEIAFQTNLLALNAGVEAARAGDAGRGFAVVASEVRALAQRSAQAAKEIKGLISTSSVQVGQGVDLVAQTGKSLERIMAQVAEINTVVADIAAGAHEQATGLDQVNTAIGQMDMVTQQNASMVEESTAASHSLNHETTQLAGLIGRFNVGESAASGGLRRELQKVAPHAFRQPAKGAPAPARPEPRKAPSTASPRVAKKAVANGGADAAGDWEEF